MRPTKPSSASKPSPFTNHLLDVGEAALKIVSAEERALGRDLSVEERKNILAIAANRSVGLPDGHTLPSVQARVADVKAKLGLGRVERGVVVTATGISIGAPLPKKGR